MEKDNTLKQFPTEPPGNWKARNLMSCWYEFYGLLVITFRFISFREILSRRQRYDPENEQRIPGEVVVITGGPRGIAYELVKKFLKMDYIIIMGVRDIPTSQARVDHIREQGISIGIIHLLPLNLKSLTATKEFADGVGKITNRIDLLINNAGIMMTPFECTEDGFESHFQVNYLSHFLLTLLLLPILKRTGIETGRSCRIINTTSAYHHAGSIDFQDLEMRSIHSPPKCYFDSKLCQILFTKQLEKMLQQDNAKVHAYAVHPGAIPTELWSQAGGIHRLISSVLKYLLPDAEGGADAIIHAALSNKLENKGGAYLERFKVADTSCEANSVCDQVILWDRSTFLCKIYLSGNLN